jgi:hypothetical protein
MAGALLIATNRPLPLEILAEDLRLIGGRLRPAGLTARSPRIAQDRGVTAVLLEPAAASQLKGTSICLGSMLGDDSGWDRPGAPAPDGNYAIMRSDDTCIELVADAAASRTIWYAETLQCFIAATSQRAIVMLLRNFEANRRVIPWMLSTGTLGPSGGWDMRLNRLDPRERVLFDRRSWHISTSTPRFDPEPRRRLNARDHAVRVEAAVRDACRNPALDTSRWLLPLSGGVDSRGLLAILSERHSIDAVTWGVDGAEREPGNDARVAHSIARQFGARHRYLRLEASGESCEDIVERFVSTGEGRVARISGYTDGFAIWRMLNEEGWDGIVRGDEAFGGRYVADEYAARYVGNLTLLTDFFDDRELRSFGLADQQLPPALARRPDETLAAWRDRMYLEFRVPAMLAALTDLKTPYIDVTCPLLTNRVLTVVRQLPDPLRTNKRLWRAVVASRTARAPYAQRPAVKSLNDFLGDQAMLDLMLAELDSGHARNMLGPVLCRRLSSDISGILRGAAEGRRRTRLRSLLPRVVPDPVRFAARQWLRRPRRLHPAVLAFRAFLVSRSTRLLAADALVPTGALQSADVSDRDCG